MPHSRQSVFTLHRDELFNKRAQRWMSVFRAPNGQKRQILSAKALNKARTRFKVYTSPVPISNKQTRLAQWEAGEMPVCEVHPLRVVKRSGWIHSNYTLCATCIDRLPWNKAHKRRQRGRKWERIKADPVLHESWNFKRRCDYHTRKMMRIAMFGF